VQSYLTREASTAVKGLLPESAGGELAAVCSWPDTERRKNPWSTPLHFADTPGDCKFSYASTCCILKPYIPSLDLADEECSFYPPRSSQSTSGPSKCTEIRLSTFD
jgi:hypothetical protein